MTTKTKIAISTVAAIIILLLAGCAIFGLGQEGSGIPPGTPTYTG